MATNHHIDYVEFRAHDLDAIKSFYTKAFGWTFTDYGPNYVAFEDSGIKGGFEVTTDPIVNGVLVVLYAKDLEQSKDIVMKAGGKIVVDIFSFPGGRRFQFTDPSGNELAVWSE